MTMTTVEVVLQYNLYSKYKLKKRYCSSTSNTRLVHEKKPVYLSVIDIFPKKKTTAKKCTERYADNAVEASNR